MADRAVASTIQRGDRLNQARAALEAVGQDHLLRFHDHLDAEGRDRLLSQVEQLDWPGIAALIREHGHETATFRLPEKIDPAPWYPNRPTPDLEGKYAEARQRGDQLIRDGRIAAFTVAGGQGTRLGWKGPKGGFPATPVRGLCLFGCLAEYIDKVQRKYDAQVPWYVMTSTENHEQTLELFEREKHFGLDPGNLMFFSQAMLPAFDKDSGKVLLTAPDRLALSPNGHGGSLMALYESGATADMKRRGIELISYTQIDNPIVKVIDPVFTGLHALDGGQMSSKVIRKTYPKERLGNFCMVDGRITIIEYSDLPDDLAHEQREDGELRFNAGSIALHVIQREFVESLNEAPGGFALPYHRAEKKVPCVDIDTGELVEPDEPNAVKLETFVFDALPLCETSVVYETERSEEFAPIKNEDRPGCVECPSWSRMRQTQRAAAWLEQHGVTVPRNADGEVDAEIEISHRTAVEPDDLKEASLPQSIDPGQSVLL